MLWNVGVEVKIEEIKKLFEYIDSIRFVFELNMSQRLEVRE